MQAAIAGALVAGGLVLGALPAAAHASYYHIVNVGSWLCLDSDWNGDVYLNRCQTYNPYQDWQIWQGGFTKNRMTGMCLTGLLGLGPSHIKTMSCSDGRPSGQTFQQSWHNWWWGWYQRPAFWGLPALCLSKWSSSWDVTAVRCADPNYAPTAERWYTDNPYD